MRAFRRSTPRACPRRAGYFRTRCSLRTEDTTIGLTIAGAMTPAGIGGCVVEMMDRGLVDFIISTGANLYHDLHHALNFTLHRGSPFVDDVALYEQGIIRIYDVLFPASVLLETDSYIRDFLVRSKLEGPITTAELHYRIGLDLLKKFPGCEEHSVVARAALVGVPIYTSSPGRQLHRHEHRVSRAAERQHADDRSEQGRQRSVRHHPRGQAQRLRHSRRRIPEELLPAGAADALGGLRHSKRRQRLLHTDYDRLGGVGRVVRRDAGRGGQLGQGESWGAAGYRGGVLRLDDRLSAVLRVRDRVAERQATAQRARAPARRVGGRAETPGHGGTQGRAEG